MNTCYINVSGKVVDLPTLLRQRNSALTAKELAELLGCTQSYVLRLAKRGIIPNYRIRGLIRFDGKQVADMLDTGK